MKLTVSEVTSQPGVWRTGLALTEQARRELAAEGERMLLLGCGTSWFVAQSIAELRESAGLGGSEPVWANV
jgi:glucosamine--fructose-6-phosphate aminotransferase (isomerizing)